MSNSDSEFTVLFTVTLMWNGSCNNSPNSISGSEWEYLDNT